MDRKAFLIAAGAGAAVQALLVLAGHFVVFIADNLFAVGGFAIAAAAGAFYARRAEDGGLAAAGGAATGAAAAAAGNLVAILLGDVPLEWIVVGALAGALAGALGAAGWRLAAARRDADKA
jgi:hypothetical protein